MTDTEHRAEENGNRATIALVSAKVDEVKAIVKGHADTTEAKLDAMNERLAIVPGLEASVAAQHEMLSLLQARVVILEKRDSTALDNRWKIAALVFSAGALAVSVLAVVLQNS